MIFYFSGTGNSMYVAKQIEEDGKQIKTVDENIGEYEDKTIGFVFPVFCGAVPRIFQRFVEQSNFKADYIYAIATAGGSAGQSINQLNKILYKKGLKLDYADCIIMPDSCMVFHSTVEEKRKQLEVAEDKLIEIKAAIQNRTTKVLSNKYNKLSVDFMWFGMRYIYGIRHKKASEKCVKCGRCVSICPEHNISIIEGKVIFKGACTDCFACIQWCPEHAISFGRLKVMDKTAYTNPAIQADELIADNISNV